MQLKSNFNVLQVLTDNLNEFRSKYPVEYSGIVINHELKRQTLSSIDYRFTFRLSNHIVGLGNLMSFWKSCDDIDRDEVSARYVFRDGMYTCISATPPVYDDESFNFFSKLFKLEYCLRNDSFRFQNGQECNFPSCLTKDCKLSGPKSFRIR